MTDPTAPDTDEPEPVETADPADSDGPEQDLEDQKEALPDDVERFQGG